MLHNAHMKVYMCALKKNESKKNSEGLVELKLKKTFWHSRDSR